MSSPQDRTTNDKHDTINSLIVAPPTTAEDASIEPAYPKRVRKVADAAIKTINQDLMGVIASYQNGIAEDMRTLADVVEVAVLHITCGDDDSIDIMDENLNRLHNALTQWLEIHGMVFIDAIWFDNRPLFEYCVAKFGPVSNFPGHLIDVAAYRDRLDLVKFLHEQGHTGCTSIAMAWAAANGNMAMLQYLERNRSEKSNCVIGVGRAMMNGMLTLQSIYKIAIWLTMVLYSKVRNVGGCNRKWSSQYC
ncbi:Aste57867_330 [Aphanomyces stellatus]|uniref:Aste57867_330 protein n=1 Tax=Aphanomyces stellatus TaxID=120398 RepID=A0A485K5F9_9STRA|nr:hypothetical protein As57867_000330 [Aphanomyces stellatus]VFT77556.1 Aste57867_330 [Aphanomyces stellatus]